MRTLEQAVSAGYSKTWLGLALRLISKLTETFALILVIFIILGRIFNQLKMMNEN